MKKTAYLICFGLIAGAVGCAKAAVVDSYSVEGSWVFQNAGESSYTERTLVFRQGVFEETNTENGVCTLNEGGGYSIQQDGSSVEIILTGTNARIYSGKVASAGLMIEKINGILLSPPAFYKKS